MSRADERFPATDRKVLRRLDEAALRQAALGILATLMSFVAIVAVSDLWHDRPRLTVVLGGMLLAVALLQAVLIFGFDAIYPRAPQRWRRQLVATLILRAAIWSAFVIVLLETRQTSDPFYLAMFLPLALGAALSATWLADLHTPRIYLLISLLPPAIDLVWRRGPDGLLVALFLGVFFYALVRVGGHHYRMFWRLLSRIDTHAPSQPALTGSVPARLLVRTADEFRPAVATISDVLTLVGENRHDAVMLAGARRSAAQLVGRLELLTEAAVLLRGERELHPVAGSLRRRCEENADDIGVVAADAGVLLTTAYDSELPERLRTDYSMFFRALRVVAVWLLEQLPAGSELTMRFLVARTFQEDRLRCQFDAAGLYLSPELRSALARAVQSGKGMLDAAVPWPLAVAGEQARLLGGRLALVDTAAGDALALEIALEVVDKEAAPDELSGLLRGQRVLMLGVGQGLAGALAGEFDALGMPSTVAVWADVVDAVRTHQPRLLLLDGRDVASLGPAVRSLRQAGLAAGLRMVALAPGAEAPVLPDDVQKLVPDWLRLPIGRRRLRQYLARTAGVEDRKTGEAEAATSPLRVLVVEDNPVNQHVARGMLEKLGCEVEVLGEGGVAVERLLRGGIDLVLMDAEMPGMDGSEATRRIRAREMEQGLPHLPVLAMTAHASEEEVAGFLAAGMDDCIAKPVSLATLAARIERYRQRR